MVCHGQRDQGDNDHADNHPGNGPPSGGIFRDNFLPLLPVLCRGTVCIRVFWVRVF